MRVSLDLNDAGYTGPLPGVEITFNGEVQKSVITADDATGVLVRYRRDAAGQLSLDEQREIILTESLVGVVTITKRTAACGCHQCSPITLDNMRMILCSTCGNKRCPKANDHRNTCTGSNEPGQAGSAY